MLFLSRFVISGHSMEPTLTQGKSILVSSIPFIFSKPKVGDIVAFKKDGKTFIKRITKINGEKYFISGDNEKDSLDSRKFGWINKSDILGKVIYY